MPFGVRGILHLKTFTARTLPVLKFLEIRKSTSHLLCNQAFLDFWTQRFFYYSSLVSKSQFVIRQVVSEQS